MSIADKLEIKHSIGYDFLLSMRRLHCKDHKEWFSNMSVLEGKLEPDPDISIWINENSEKLTPSIKELFEKFFDYETTFGITIISELLMSNIDSVDSLIKYIKEKPAKELVKTFLNTGLGPYVKDRDFSIDKIFDNEKEMLVFVSESMLFNTKQKALLLEFIDNPETTKEEYIYLLEWYQENIFKSISKTTSKRGREGEKLLVKYLAEYGEDYFWSFCPLDLRDQVSEFNRIILIPSYFVDIYSGLSVNIEEGVLTVSAGIGLLKFLGENRDPYFSAGMLFHALSDTECLKILRLVNNREVPAGEIAKELNLKNHDLTSKLVRLSMSHLIKCTTSNDNLTISTIGEEVKKIVMDTVNKVFE